MTDTVDPTNQNLAQAWDGDEGSFWAANAQRFDDAVAGYHSMLMDAAAIQSRDRVLDVGCGNGQVTLDAARAAAQGSALGVDLSNVMLDVARSRAASQGITNASFENADAQIHPFETGSFDVVVSRNGAMFFGDRLAAFANLRRALAPDGRLAMLVWQGPEPQDWMNETRTALAVGRDIPGPPVGAPGPFMYADPDEARHVLTSTGFTDVQVDGVTAQIRPGADVDEAQDFVLGQLAFMLQGLDDEQASLARANLRATLTAHLTDAGVTFDSAAWLVRAVAG